MKAITYRNYGNPDVLKIEDFPNPEPKADEILVKIHYSTVSAVDSIFRRGDAFFARMATGAFKPKNPVLGNDFAGVVESAGSDVKSFSKGDLVFGESPDKGTHTEFVAIKESGPVTKVPENLTPEQAVSLSYGGLTALPFLRDSGRLESGQSVLILGASGSVGSSAVQIAKILGAKVTGVCSTANVDLVKSLGADDVIDYRKQNYNDTGQKWDIIFDTVGKSSFAEAKNSLTDTGTYMNPVISFGMIIKTLMTNNSKGKRGVFAATGMRKPPERKKDLETVAKWASDGKIKPVIDKVYLNLRSSKRHIRLWTKGIKRGA
jgi:NADPH:quinone reductase-like Zn-dependent oxidoreductase